MPSIKSRIDIEKQNPIAQDIKISATELNTKMLVYLKRLSKLLTKEVFNSLTVAELKLLDTAMRDIRETGNSLNALSSIGLSAIAQLDSNKSSLELAKFHKSKA